GATASSREVAMQAALGGLKNTRQLLTSAGYESSVEAIQFKKEQLDKQLDKRAAELFPDMPLEQARHELENNPVYTNDLAEI
ncbi:hypothetical protein RNH99_30675, partial [Pseudomonas paraeruginosa]|uniref:hypothetical protein n=1 Tax=Pseudomonas paraeruginosa TaxID=2994495 RepID=UPI00288727A0